MTKEERQKFQEELDIHLDYVGINRSELAEIFGITPGSFSSSSARTRYKKAFIKIVQLSVKAAKSQVKIC